MGKVNARVVLNRAALDATRLGLADGLFNLGKAILDATHPPDDPPYGEGLVTKGGVIVWVDGKKVDGFGQDGKQPKKPRALRMLTPGITAVVGYGFPARFNEMGTIHQPSRPFFSPAVGSVLPDSQRTIKAAIHRFLARF